MTIQSLQESKELRKQGARLGRAGMSQRAHDLVMAYVKKNDGEPHYFDAVELIGRLHAIYIATRGDGYWRQKAQHGYWLEFHDIRNAQSPEVTE